MLEESNRMNCTMLFSPLIFSGYEISGTRHLLCRSSYVTLKACLCSLVQKTITEDCVVVDYQSENSTFSIHVGRDKTKPFEGDVDILRKQRDTCQNLINSRKLIIIVNSILIPKTAPSHFD